MKYLAVVAATLIVYCAGCDRKKSEEEDTGGASRHSRISTQQKTAVDIEQTMHDYFSASTTARDAIVQGDLEETKAALGKLANYRTQPKDAPVAWQPFLQMWRATARIGARSAELSEAATAVGKLGMQCANCHSATRKGPRYDPSGWVEEIKDLQTHMLLLRWATDRMWEGLTEPWDRAWVIGAETLAEAPLEWHEIPKLPKNEQKQVKELSGNLIELAKQAQKQSDLEARADTYASLILTCSHCHQLLDQ